MKILKHLLNLSLFIIGCYYPLVWVVLIIFVLAQRDYETRISNERILSTRFTQPFTEAQYIDHIKKAYLASPEWDTKRKQVLERDLYACQGCGNTGIPLEVHHITYTNYGSESLSDLVTVCRPCHQSIHDKYGYNYSDTFPLEKQ